MILITGCARSGTSLTTAVLRACGMGMGNTKINDLNEAQRVRDELNKPYLKAIGADPLGQGPLPDIERVTPDPTWREKVLALMGGPSEPWGFKDAKTSLIWPVWHAAFPEATWVLVRRDAEKIVDSCVRTHFMRRYEGRDGWRGWVRHHEQRFAEIRKNCRAIEVWPSTYPAAFRAAVEYCGLTWDEDAVKRVIDPGRWH